MFSASVMFFTMACLVASSLGSPYQRREVPQEHAHQKFLTNVTALLQSGNAAENNPLGILDAVFGLLGNAAGAQGAGKVTDVTCLQQATADQAFTNAKKTGDVVGMTAALAYRTLERNTGKVGLKSDLCTSIKAVNPEIAVLTQHQDPASGGAKEGNKAIVLELARQIASVNGDPLVALQTGTFAPGDPNDPTGKGNSCDDQPDPIGCIETKNLLVPDATEAEILAAVAGNGGAASGNQGGSANEEVANNSSTGAGAAGTASITATNAKATVSQNATEASATAVETTSAAEATATGTATAGEAVLATATATNGTECAAQATVTVTVTAGATQSTGATEAKHASAKHQGLKGVIAGIAAHAGKGSNKATTSAGDKGSHSANSTVSATEAVATVSATDTASTDTAAASPTETVISSQSVETAKSTAKISSPASATQAKALKSRFFGRTFA